MAWIALPLKVNMSQGSVGGAVGVGAVGVGVGTVGVVAMGVGAMGVGAVGCEGHTKTAKSFLHFIKDSLHEPLLHPPVNLTRSSLLSLLASPVIFLFEQVGTALRCIPRVSLKAGQTDSRWQAALVSTFANSSMRHA